MKILCVADGIPVDYTVQLANSLSKKGLDVNIMLNYQDFDEFDEFLENNVNKLLKNKIKSLYDIKYNIKLFFDILNKIKELKPDIIHLQEGNLFWILILIFVKEYSLITTFHDIMLHPGRNKLNIFITQIVRFFLIKKSKYIFVHGKKLKNDFMLEYKYPKEKIIVISMGEINVSPFKKYFNENITEDNSILFFGWIAPRKGLKYLIESEKYIKREINDFKIVIAGKVGGDGQYYKECMDLIGNNSNFKVYPHFISWIDGACLLQKCNMVVLPYVEVSQSGVIPTAYGFEKPVIITNVGSMPEIVDEGETGYIVPPKDSKSLAKAIIKLLKNNKMRKRMGQNAHKKLVTDLSWEKISNITIEVYQKALK